MHKNVCRPNVGESKASHSDLRDTTRRQLWNLLQEGVRLSRYYHTMVQRMSRRNHLLIMIQLVLGAVSLCLAVLSADYFTRIVASLLSAAVAFIALLLVISNYPEKLATIRMISQRCSEMVVDIRSLWNKTEAGLADPSAIPERRESIERELLHATTPATHVGIRTSNRINRKAVADVSESVRKDPTSSHQNEESAADGIEGAVGVPPRPGRAAYVPPPEPSPSGKPQQEQV